VTTLIPTVLLLCVKCALRFRAASLNDGRRCICGGNLKHQAQTRAELQAAHGTAVQFGSALLRAYNQLFITSAELDEAIARYRAEWQQALP
jgi:hypothetical protein